ncbi:MAG: signal peptide peptidase SppA [Rhodospirillales bacterium]|jgi:protease-4
MALDADLIVDRRRLKRRLNFWCLLALALIVAVVIIAVGRFDLAERGDRVARLAVSGVLHDNFRRGDLLKNIRDNVNIRALIVHINSPGGTVVGGEALYQGLKDVAGTKPVVAVLGELATSAAYMAAVGADHIIARAGTVTGSIGVLMQTADITGMLKNLGIAPVSIKSSPLKAQPSPLEPFTDEARTATRDVVSDMYAMFVDMLVEGRAMNRDRVLVLADGRIFTGRQALAHGLIDAIGAEPEARQWLAANRNVALDLPAVDVEVEERDGGWTGLLSSLIGKTLFSERLTLDGLLSVWHPNIR